jgi:hypothetical protein
MKPYHLAKDSGLKFQRVAGKRKGSARLWREAAAAKVAPHELDHLDEETIHDLMEAEITMHGFAYLSLRSRYFNWLNMQANKGEWIAKDMLKALSGLPDLMVFDKDMNSEFSRMLSLELKTIKGKARPEQKNFRDKVNGYIIKGFAAAQEALRRFAA